MRVIASFYLLVPLVILERSDRIKFAILQLMVRFAFLDQT
jgi:hypothetical protein